MSANPQEPAAKLTAFDLLLHFTSLRQSGVNRDDAWYQVCDSASDVNQVTIKAFLNLAKNWERQQGHKYHYRTPAEKESTQSGGLPVVKKEAAPASAPKVEPPPKPPSPRKEALTGTLDPRKLRQNQQAQIENVLDQLDDESDDSAKPAPNSQTPPATRTAPLGYKRDFFGTETALLMFFKTSREPVRVTIVGEDELFIGRMTSNTAMAPEIDLNIVNAGDYGVSRMHAAITRRNNQLLITDLESLNFTYVNGMRLLPQEIRALQDGDEIWFGQLQCRIRFQHA
jgi:pSer/pThr/pTyr-binding forkhead associated (FHA) protein